MNYKFILLTVYLQILLFGCGFKNNSGELVEGNNMKQIQKTVDKWDTIFTLVGDDKNVPSTDIDEIVFAYEKCEVNFYSGDKHNDLGLKNILEDLAKDSSISFISKSETPFGVEFKSADQISGLNSYRQVQDINSYKLAGDVKKLYSDLKKPTIGYDGGVPYRFSCWSLVDNNLKNILDIYICFRTYDLEPFWIITRKGHVIESEFQRDR